MQPCSVASTARPTGVSGRCRSSVTLFTSARRVGGSNWRVSARPPAHPDGYAAADAPERRKNPELYKNLRLPEGTDALPQLEGPAAHRGEPLPKQLRRPDVLAPAGGWPQLRAAAENGADCVYFGLTEFNARARAENFTLEELPEVMDYLHDRGLRGYVTLNILIFDSELSALEEQVKAIARAGVDAVIVQDIGAVEVLRRAAPNLPIHGSTQMSVTSAEGARFAEERGVRRVVIGRELSVREIAMTGAGTGAEIEAFVHGAMCVSYSGQCFSSEAWGGRSANRGQCAQACRLPYGLLVNGVLKELADIQFLLSPQDLMGLSQVPALVQAGVSCLKIEGRLKGPEYVAATTAVYRAAVDHAMATLSAGGSSEAALLPVPRQQAIDLRQVFARGQDEEHDGLTPGFLAGVAHQRLVRGRAPRHRGVLLGRVQRVDAALGGVWVDLEGPVKRGDGVVFDAGKPMEREQGGSVMGVLREGGAAAEGRNVGAQKQRTTHKRKGGRGRDVQEAGLSSVDGEVSEGMALLRLRSVDVDWKAVAVGQLVWRSLDAGLEGRLRSTYESKADADLRRVAVHVTATGRLGQPLSLEFHDRDGGHEVRVSTTSPLDVAQKRPMDEGVLGKALGKTLGGGTFGLAGLDVSGLDMQACLYVAPAEIKEARRTAVEQLTAARRFHNRGDDVAVDSVLPPLVAAASSAVVCGQQQWQASGDCDNDHDPFTPDTSDPPVLRLLCRTQDQVEAALEIPWLDEITLDFLEVHGLRSAVQRVQSVGKRAVVATPRILKPDEQRLSTYFLQLGADALLVRSTGMLQVLKQAGGEGAVLAGSDAARVPPLLGDFSLNAANVLTAGALLSTGLRRLAPTYDLNAAQIAKLAEGLGPRQARRVEAVLHQHLPIFHMEHCVFCRFLSSGNDYTDCGHPCERNSIHLRDSAGKDHLVLADMGCRNTVFNSQAQSGIHYVDKMTAAGVRQFRVELVDERAAEVRPLLEGYAAVLRGERSADSLWEWLQGVPDANGNAHGVTTGSLGVHKERSRSKTKMKPTAAALRGQR